MAALVVVALALAACGGDGDTAADGEGDGDEGGATPIHVSLSEWMVAPGEMDGMEGMGDMGGFTAQAGEVTFEVHNDGTVPHELVVVKSDLAPGALPVAGGAVDEAQVEVIGEVEEFEAGTIETGTFQLDAGSYVLFCNIAGHYEQGMSARLTVE
ncbi:MAG: hypothetical protein HY658_06305 [Actinobacteria bacterium]|nr:hypothetical protein [Actinomycetota bacterium]